MSSNKLITLNVGTVTADAGANIFYAHDLGLFAEHGLDVVMHRMPGERDRCHTGAAMTQILSQAVTTGGLDIGLANVVTVALARADGVPLRFLASAATIFPGARQFDEVMVAKDSPLTPGPSMNGKTCAINRLHNLQEVCAIEWLNLHGGDGSSLKFVECPFNTMGEALRDGRAEVLFTSEPFGTRNLPFAKVIGNAFEGIGEQFALIGWFATDDWLAANADAAARFAAAMNAASAWANAHQFESAEMLAARPGTLVSADFARTMNRVTYGTSLEAAMFSPLLDLAVKYGLLAAPVPPADLIWTAPVRA
jgi:ABC-type nitrate/sulfonate/bicarbonate transport system substrate-binding protein